MTTIPTFERHIRVDHRQEHAALYDPRGNLITRRSGTYDSVQFTPDELERACGGLLTHNHPRALPPSANDLSVAAQYGLTLRAVGMSERGDSWDYTVRMAAPSLPLADILHATFDDAVEQAEHDLSGKAYDDRMWEREARHLAVRRLAHQHQFFYQRVLRDAPISEATRHERKRLNMLATVEKTLRDEWLSPLHASLVRSLNRHMAADGRVPRSRLDLVRREWNGVVQKSMLGAPQTDGSLTPYTVQHGQVQPRSLFFRTVWGLLIQGAAVAIERHAAMMRRYLPQDLQQQFQMATLSPFDTEAHEIGPSPRYDPLHLWLGKDGKQLSDRVWQVTGDMRRRLDDYLTGAIARDIPVAQMTRELESYLLPGKGAYEAMRLARTEVSAAMNRADSAAAQMNPFVATYSFFTAPQHQCCDVCDEVQEGSPYPKDDVAHLPPQHPNCICGIVWNTVQDIKGVVSNLRQQIEQALTKGVKSIADWIGPLSKRLLDLLFRGKP